MSTPPVPRSRRSRLRRGLAAAGAALLVAPLATVLQAAPAAATPVAADDASYERCGRVFPDPQAFWPASAPAPGESPWAKGNAVCRAVDYIQYDEAVKGVEYLEERFPDFVEVYDLSKDFSDVLDRGSGEGLSAGLPTTTGERAKLPLYLVRVTDENSPVAEEDKKLFLFGMGMHGLEKAGLEGGLRALEDLVTWGATTPEQPVMETDGTSVPAGVALQQSASYFLFANPDGWARGDTSRGGPAYMRYNGNGVDLNRDWPEQGFTYRPYTPFSEPESRAVGKVLKSIRDKWDGGVDLHGQLVDRAYSFTLVGPGQKDYGKNQETLDFTKGAYDDAEKRLAWNPTIKPNDAPEACVPLGLDPSVSTDPGCDPTPRVYGVQYGTIWDTIAYTATGALGNWGESPIGLDGVFVDNEMSLSHLANCYNGKCFAQSAEQLHVDGNKSLIFGMVNFGLQDSDTRFDYPGPAGYLFQPERLQEPGSGEPVPPSELPTQDPVEATMVHAPGQTTTSEFEVLGPDQGVSSGGLQARFTFSNVQGMSPASLLRVAVDRFAPRENSIEGEWITANSDYNQSFVYLQAGMTVDVNDLVPGRYRLRVTGSVPATVNAEVTFTDGRAWPDPGQLPVDVSNLDFFADLSKYVPAGSELRALPASDVAAGTLSLDGLATVVAADRTFADDPALAAALKAFVERGGNLVLTDDALRGLETMGLVPAGSVREQLVYAGSVKFRTAADSADTYADPLASEVDQPGTAEGPGNRRQTVEPSPLGFAIQTPSGGDKSSVPQWGVDPQAWTAAGGRTVGLTGDGEQDDVTYGELPVGSGQVRILGSLLPFPSDEYDHPFGLASYAVTFTGYQLFSNLISSGVAAIPVDGGSGPGKGGDRPGKGGDGGRPDDRPKGPPADKGKPAQATAIAAAPVAATSPLPVGVAVIALAGVLAMLIRTALATHSRRR